MISIEIELFEDVVSVIHRLTETADTEIELIIPKGAVILENIVNLKLLKDQAQKMQKTVLFNTEDESGRALLENLEEEKTGVIFDQPEVITVPKAKVSRRLPKFENFISMFKNIHFTKGNKKIYLIFGVAGLALILLISKLPKAAISIVLTPEPLTRSLAITVSKEATTDAQKKILGGIAVQVTAVDTLQATATGQKVIGKKAQGKVVIYNTTDTETTFKKGAKLTYTKNDKDYVYILDENATVPAQTVTPGTPPTVTPGQTEEIPVMANDIGSSYNLDKNKSLRVNGYKDNQFTASVSTAVSGGQSSTVKIISAEDQTAVAQLLQKTLLTKATKALEAKLASGQKLIEGSVQTQETKNVFDHNIGDQTDTFSLTQTLTVAGLAYSINDLNKLIDSLVSTLIPNGYVASTKERELKVAVLGNSDTSILSVDKADIQVTVKTFVIPEVDTDKLKATLKGKSISEAEKLLSELKSTSSYSITVSPSLPFLRRIPNDLTRINLEVKSE